VSVDVLEATASPKVVKSLRQDQAVLRRLRAAIATPSEPDPSISIEAGSGVPLAGEAFVADTVNSF
jgi:hypothetical protein